MIAQTEGQIYLAGQRGVFQLSEFRSFHTFNFGSYQDESRAPFGSLETLNDDTLAAGKSFVMKLEKNTESILIPVVGAVAFQNSLGEKRFLEAGQFQIFSTDKPVDYEISNPYETELVNYIQIRLKNNQPQLYTKTQEGSFDLQKRNQLIPIFSPAHAGLKVQQEAYGYIGKYGGREEGVYHIKNPENGIFVFIIEGAFEVQNRLLETRDGLSLLNLEELEFEALSNDAIILILEINVDKTES
ncbi:pirin [Dyadobacter sp. CY345]|uniref:pirin family protein n=1 Tax=Dyadobacter sp. CY345 TaxID=2909335 RepID=UPI001F2E101D|nr:pirin [Dyadobacter sp. CY345]MCF2446297.1 pirin [Dyadobacter sp. CY345]